MEVDFASVTDNYAALPEEEKTIVREGMSGPMGVIIGKLFGPEFMEGVGTFAAPAAPTPAIKPRTMAPTMPQQQPQAKPQGLAARPQR